MIQGRDHCHLVLNAVHYKEGGYREDLKEDADHRVRVSLIGNFDICYDYNVTKDDGSHHPE